MKLPGSKFTDKKILEKYLSSASLTPYEYKKEKKILEAYLFNRAKFNALYDSAADIGTENQIDYVIEKFTNFKIGKLEKDKSYER